ncbi:fungal-specific transcription factor domain-containing protein [Geopyxis carbonaria]|nr:fungal-specific transcription factor domain-containing protein [Geopyxis carbonaria]
MTSPNSKKQKPLKWVTFDHGMENTSELRAAAEAVPGRPNVRFLNHEGPNEKDEDFRRTVRMHVMRDYRQRMRELAASGEAEKNPISKSTKQLSPPKAGGSRSRKTSPAPPTSHFPSNSVLTGITPSPSRDGYGSEDSEEFWQSTNTPRDVSLQSYRSLLSCNYGFGPNGPPSPSNLPGSSELATPSYDELYTSIMGVIGGFTPYNNDHNPFMHRILPMAYQCPAALYALSALSSAHRGKNENVRGLSYRVSAISCLNKDLESAASTRLAPDQRQWIMDKAVATSFLIGTYDYIDTGVTGWDMRMAGCTHLVNMCGGPSALGFDGLLQQLFGWYDVFGSSLTFSQPTLSGPYWMPSHDQLDRGLWPICQLLGPPDGIMSLVSEMSVLSNTLRNSPGANISNAAAVIEDRLHTWSPETQLRPRYGEGWEQCWEAFRLASLIYLYTILYRCRPSEVTVRKYARRLFDLLEHHTNPEFVKCLLWVVFLAGTVAETAEDQRLVQALAGRGWHMSRIGAWKSAIHVLEGMWSSGANLWEVVLDAEKRGVAYLFI